MKKKILSLGFSFLLTTTSMHVLISSVSSPAYVSGISAAQPYSNHTGYKYQTINGKIYKRLWSYTYSRWEDPYWTLV